MNKEIIIGIILSSIIANANSNINNSGSFVNNGTINKKQSNNYDNDKANFDSKIRTFSNKIMKNKNIKSRNKGIGIITAATQANKFNISSVRKKEKCVENALSIGIYKIKASYARKECSKIFF